jgi:acetyl esterase/lipase
MPPTIEGIPVKKLNRRHFLAGTTAVSTIPFLVTPTQAAPIVKKTTYTYKTVEKLEIKLDVYRADDRAVRPLAVWIHGGALIMGHREGISGRVKNDLLEAGYALASIDYRLAPETKLNHIISDVEDAFGWLHKNSQMLNVNPNKTAVLGGSAGGYLTLTAGFRAKPRPTVLVSFWGYGDLIGDWYSTPSKHARHHRSNLSAEKAYEQVNGPPISDSRQRPGDGGAFYQFCRQQGRWPYEVSGFDPAKTPEKFKPFMPLANVAAGYPPTLMIHGTTDTDVPYEQSVLMQNVLQKHRIEHRLITIEDGEHGLGGGDRQAIDAAYGAVVPFINKHMAT